MGKHSDEHGMAPHTKPADHKIYYICFHNVIFQNENCFAFPSSKPFMKPLDFRSKEIIYFWLYI